MKWKTLSSVELMKTGFFRLRSDKCELPDKRQMPNYYVIEFSDWVNVVPVTKDKQVVLIKQYRHAVDAVTVEVPGGMVDSHKGEEPLAAATRELREETGYTASELKYVGWHWPNPALQSNRVHTYLAVDCKKTAEPELDPFEDIEVFTRSIPDVLAMIKKGEIVHTIVMASILRAFQE